MRVKEYVLEVPVKGFPFFIEVKSVVHEMAPHFKKELGIAAGKAAEKILEDNNLDVSQIASISWSSAHTNSYKGDLPEFKLYDIKIKTQDGKIYSLKEYTYPDSQPL